VTPITFSSAADALRFVRSGRAVFTVRSRKTGDHRTYRVFRKDADGPFFAGLLAGPDNTSDYVYLGVLADDGAVRLTVKSKMKCDSVPVRALAYVARHLAAGTLPPDADVMHEGRCGVCGRPLTVPESLERGIGPDCWDKMNES
jgi:Family of unknown function (DUF6011)